MDGTDFYLSTPGKTGKTKEVNILDKFIFDLQRFEDGETRTKITINSVDDLKQFLANEDGKSYYKISGNNSVKYELEIASGVTLELDKTIVIASGADVKLTLTGSTSKTATKIVEASSFDTSYFGTGEGAVTSLFRVEGTGKFEIAGTSSTSSTIVASSADAVVSLANAGGETGTPTFNFTSTVENTTYATKFAKITGSKYGVYAEAGTVDIDGGYVIGTGEAGIYQKGGELKFDNDKAVAYVYGANAGIKLGDSSNTTVSSASDAKLTADKGKLNVYCTGSDTGTAAIVASGAGVTATLGSNVSITSTNHKGANGLFIENNESTDSGKASQITISGGTYTKPATGVIANNDTHAKITVSGGTFSEALTGVTGLTVSSGVTGYSVDGQTKYYDSSGWTTYSGQSVVAKIGNDYYTTLAKANTALASAGSSSKIELTTLGNGKAQFSTGSGNATKYYDTLSSAVSGVDAGGTIKVIKDSASITSASVDKAFTLDLNGKTLTSTSTSYGLYVKAGGDVTITDSTSGAAGKFTNSGATQVSGLIYVTGGGKVTLDKGSLESTTYTVRLASADDSFEMKGGAITNTQSTFTYNSNTYVTYGVLNSGGTVTMSGGTITASGYGVVNDGTFNMSGGEVKSGSSNITIGQNSNYGAFGINNSGTLSLSGTAKVTGISQLGIYNNGANANLTVADNAEVAVTQSTAIQGNASTITINGGKVSGATGIAGVNGTHVTMSDGEISCVGNYGAVQLGYNNGNKEGNTTEYGDSFTMSGGKITATGNGSGVNLFNGGEKFTMTGGTIATENSFAISNNGNKYNLDTEITLEAATGKTISVTSKGAQAIYHAGAGTINIKSGTYTGTSGLEIRAGTANIEGGTFQAGTLNDKGEFTSAASYSYTQNGGGSTTDGAGIAVAQHTTKKDITLNIGTGDASDNTNIQIKGPVALSVANPQHNTAEENPPLVNIKGGTFTGTKGTAIATETLTDGTVTITDPSGATQTSTPDAANASDSRVHINITGGVFDGTLNRTNSDTAVTGSTTADATDNGNGSSYDILGSAAYFTKAGYASLSFTGYKVTSTTVGTNTYYQVDFDGVVALVGQKSFASLGEAVAYINAGTAATDNNGNTIKLLDDVTVSSKLAISADTVLDLGGKTVTSSVITAFDVAGGKSFTVKDTVEGNTGKIYLDGSNVTYAAGALINVASGGKFIMDSGNIDAPFQVLSLTGAEATITGTANIKVTAPSDVDVTPEAAFNAIALDNASTLTVGKADDSTASPTIKVDAQSYSPSEANAIYAASGGTESSKPAVNVYGGSIEVTGANVPATNAINFAGAGAIKVAGGTISAAEGATTNYGIYTAGASVVLDGGTITGGTETGLVSKGDDISVKIKGGVTLDGQETKTGDFYTTTTSGDSLTTYAVGQTTLTAGTGTNAWLYTYGAGSADDGYLGQSGTISLAGDLFNANSLSAVNVSVGAGTLDSVKILSFSGDGLNLSGTASLKVTDTDDIDYQFASVASGASIGGMVAAQDYLDKNAFQLVGAGTTSSVYTFKGVGASLAGVAFDGTDTTNNTLIFRDARTQEFEFAGDVKFEDSITANTNSLAAANYFSITGSDGAYIVNISKENMDNLFANTQAAGASLKVSSDGYTLALGDTVEIYDSASFNSSLRTYQMEGYAADGFNVKSGVATYGNAAGKFSFESVGNVVNFNEATDSTNLSSWFTVTEKDGKGYEVKVLKNALQTSQTDGAVLSLSSGLTNYTLVGSALIDSATTGEYKSVGSFAAGTSVGSYVYTSKGMASAAGYVEGEDKNSLVYHIAQQGVGFQIKEADGSNGNATINVGTNKADDIFSFDGTTLTINQASVVSGMKTGDVIKVNDSTKRIALVAKTEDNDAGFQMLEAAGSTVATYKDGQYTGAGTTGSIAGYHGDSVSGYTFYDKSNKFTLSDYTLADSSDFAENVSVVGPTIGDDGKVTQKGTIVINGGALLEGLTDSSLGAAIKLDSASSAQYNFQLGSGFVSSLPSTTYNADNVWRSATKVWQSSGGTKKGFALIPSVVSGTTSETVNTEIKYVDKRYSVKFDGDAVLSTDAGMRDQFGIKVSDGKYTVIVNEKAFGEQTSDYAKLTVSQIDNAAVDAANLEISLGSGFASSVMASDDHQSLATFKDGAYHSTGASVKGYYNDTTNDKLEYYGVSKQFGITASDGVSLATAEGDTDIAKLFSINGTSSDGDLIKGQFGIKLTDAVFANAASLKAGETITLGLGKDSYYFDTSSLGDGLSSVTMGDATFVTSGSATSYKYTFAGANKNGFEVADDKDTLTYRKQAEDFTIVGSGSASLKSANIAYITTTDTDVSSIKSVSFIDKSILGESLKTNAEFRITNDGKGDEYQFAIGAFDAASDDHTSITTFGHDADSSVFAYKGSGAETAGFVIGAPDSLTSSMVYYETRVGDFDFADTTIQFVAPSLTSGDEAVKAYIEINADGKTVSLNSAALGTASLTASVGAQIKLGANDDKYDLVLGDGITKATDQQDIYTLSKTDGYMGIGAKTAGWGQKGSVDTYEFYGVADTLKVGTGASMVAFADNYSVSAGAAGVAWSVSAAQDVLKNAITFDKDKKVVTISDNRVFDSTTLVDGYKISSGSNGITLAFTDSLASGDSVANNLAAGSNNEYVWTFEGWKKAGFYTDTEKTETVYHTVADTVGVVSEIAFNTDSINAAALTQDTKDDLFIVDKTAKTITIKKDAFSGALEGGKTVKLNDAAVEAGYSLSLGSDLTSYKPGDTRAASWDSIGASGSVSSYRWIAANSAPEYSFNLTTGTGGKVSLMTYNTPGSNLNFEVTGDIDFAEPSTAVAGAISLSGTTVSVGKGAFDLGAENSMASGATFKLATDGYTLDISNLTSANNVYHSVASFENNIYTGIGMSSVDGFAAVDNTATWHGASDSIKFDVSGGLTFDVTAAELANGAISVGGADNSVVAIAKDALKTDASALYSGASFSIAGGRKEYTLTLGTDLSSAEGASDDATLNGFEFTSKGATKAGYKVGQDSKSITYYGAKKTIIFDSGSGLQFASNNAASLISVDDSNQIKIDPTAFKTGTANAATLKVNTAGYTFALSDGMTEATDIHSGATFENGTYKGVGASVQSYTANNNILTYYDQYASFAFDTTLANAIDISGVVVGDISLGGADNKSIVISDGKLGSSLTSGAVIALDSTSAKNGYALVQYGTSLSSNETNASAHFGTGSLASNYYLAGPSVTGFYLGTGSSVMTYYEETTPYQLGVKVGDSVNAITWKSGQTPAVAVNDTAKTFTLRFGQIDADQMAGDGSETFVLATTKSGQEEYTLAINNLAKLSESAITSVGSFTASGTSASLSSAGATSTGYLTTDKGLTFYKQKADDIVFSVAGEGVSFNAMPSSDTVLANYFKVGAADASGNRVITVTDQAVTSLISGVGEGVSLSANSDKYSFTFGENYQGYGNYSVASFADYKFTSAGLTGDKTHEGFTGSGNTVVYHNVADTVNFVSQSAVTFSTEAKDNISIGAADDKGIKLVTVGASALTSLKDGNVLQLATGQDSFKLYSDVTASGDTSVIGGLNYAGEYTAQNMLQSVNGALTYTGQGADADGFIANADGGLTYHTKRAHEFTLDNTGIVYADALANSIGANGISTYLEISSPADSSGAYTVTLKPTAIFAASQATSIDGAVVSIGSAYKDNYKLTATNTVSMLGSDTFSTTTSAATYIVKGAVDTSTQKTPTAGYTAADGVVTYHKAADSFSFKTGTNAPEFATPGASLALSAMFSVDSANKTVTVYEKAFTSNGLNDGDTLAFADGGNTNAYTLDASVLIGANTYSSVNTFESVEGGYTFNTAGVKLGDSTSTALGGFASVGGAVVYHTKATDINLEGDILLSDATKATLSGNNLTIDSGALSTAQTNGASLAVNNGTGADATSYKLAFANGFTDTLASGGFSTVATFNNTSRTYTTPGGTSKAGYYLDSTTNRLTYYAKADNIVFGDSVTFNALAGDSLASAIQLTEEVKDGTVVKTITVAKAAIDTSNITAGTELTLTGTNASDYTLAVADDLNGGTYDAEEAFRIKSTTTETDGTTTYTYAYKKGGGGTQAGFIWDEDFKVWTYQFAADTIEFKGNLAINELSSAADVAKHFDFTGTTTVAGKTYSVITFKNSDTENMFKDNEDGYYLALSDEAKDKYKLQIDTSFTPEAKGEEKDGGLSDTGNNTYTYTNSGVTTSKGYKVNDAGDQLIYRDLADEVVFTVTDGIVLDTDNWAENITVDRDTHAITISKNLFKNTGDGTISVTSFTTGSDAQTDYTLAWKGDTPDEYTETAAGFTNTTTPKVYYDASVTEGYKLDADNKTITYKAKVEPVARFEVSDKVDTSKVTLGEDGKTVTFGAGALTAGDSAYTASVTAKDDKTYTLTLDSSYTEPVATAEGFQEKTYKAAATTAGWKQDNLSVAYTPASGGDTLFTVSDNVNTSGVTLSGTTVTFGAGALTDSDTTYTATLTPGEGKSYTLIIDSSSYTAPQTTNAGFTNTETPKVYYDTYTSKGYTQSGLNVNYTPETGGAAMFEVSDNVDTSKVTLSGTTVTFGAGALTAGDSAYTASVTAKDDKTYTLTLDSSYTEPVATTEGFDGNTGAYKEAGVGTAGYTKDVTTVTYTPAQEGATLFTLTGVKDGTYNIIGISDQKVITLKSSNLQEKDVTVDNDNYTLALSGVDAPTTKAEGFDADNLGVYKAESVTKKGYTASGQTITFRDVAEGATLFTLTGISSTDGIVVDGTTVKVPAAALKAGETEITLTGDNYTLALGEGMAAPTSVTEPTLKEGVYTSAGVTEGYTLGTDSKTITYSATTRKSITFENLADEAQASHITVDGTEITIAKAAVKTDASAPLTLKTAGYTLKMGEGMAAPTSVTEPTLKEGVYQTAGDTEGYTLDSDNKTITYSATTRKSIEFENLADEAQASHITVDGTEITIAKAAVKTDASAPLTLKTEGYTLKMGEGMSAPTNVPEATLKEGVYTSAGDTEGYTLNSEDKTITYVEGTSKTVEFENLADEAQASNITLDGTTVTVTKAAVKTDGTALKLKTDGYTLAMGNDMSASKTVSASLSGNTYRSAGNTEGYTLDGNTITYVEGTSKTVEFENVADTATKRQFNISDDNVVTVGKAAIMTDGTPLTLKTEGYTLAKGQNMDAPTEEEATLENGVYTSAGVTEGYTLNSEDKTITYVEGTSKTVEFENLADEAQASNITLDGTTVTVTKAAVKTDGTALKLKTDGYTLAMGNDMSASKTVSASLSGNTYRSAGETDGYTLDGNTITYVEGTSKTVEFENVADTATKRQFSISDDNVVTVGKAAIMTDGTPLTLKTEGYTLAKGQNMDAPTEEEATLENGVYTSAGVTEGYTLNSEDKTITYSATNRTSVEFENIADEAEASNITLDGTTVTVGKAAVKTDATAPLKLKTEGYTLAMGEDMSASKTVSASLSGNTYRSAGETDGYTLDSDNNTITYVEGTSKTVEFENVADTATKRQFNISDDNVVTVGKAAIMTDGTPLTLKTEGYTLAMGQNMEAPTRVKKTTLTNGVYRTAGVTEGYTLDGNTITYSEGTSKTVEFENVADTATKKQFNIDGDVVTVGKAAIMKDGTPLKLKTAGYTLEMGNGMEAPTTVRKATINGNTYRTAGMTEGYMLDTENNTITYVEATSTTIEFENVADTAQAKNFKIEDDVVTVGKAVVMEDGTPLVLKTEGYTLALGQNMSEQTTVEQWSDIVDGFAAYSVVTEDGYKFSDDKRSLSFAEGSSEVSVELSGVAADSTLATVSNGVVELSASNIDSELTIESNAGEYTFSVLAGSYTDKALTGSAGADTITNAGDGLAINAGDGSDSVVSSGDSVTLDGGTGNDVLRGGSGKDSLIGGTGNDSLYGNAGNDELRGSNGKDYLNGGKGRDALYGGRGADLLEGGAGNDTLYGEADNDTLWGGAGNDHLYGGGGDDVFIYKPGEGTDTIFDYESGDMLQILKADGTEGTFTDSSLSNDRLTLTIDGGGSVIFDGVSNGDTINVNGTTHTIKDNKIK